jgi:ADP-ribose pyrophosphatase
MSRDPWALPKVAVAIVDRHDAPPGEPFLEVRRVTLQNTYEDGETSRAYVYDVLHRKALDAVVIVLVTHETPMRVCIRSAIRPPLVVRRTAHIPIAETLTSPVLWEVPAGLVEADEHGEAGLRACAARETLEETGIEAAPEAFTSLGRSIFLSPGTLGERIHFLVATVDPDARGTPTEDGSPTEERAEVRFVPLHEALAACEDGRIEDAKTEVALRRLASRNP